jgi:hypothetical protein
VAPLRPADIIRAAARPEILYWRRMAAAYRACAQAYEGRPYERDYCIMRAELADDTADQLEQAAG